MRQIKVAIVDDHPLVLCGLRKTLEDAGFDVSGAVTSPSELIKMLGASECDVVLTDYSMPGDGGLDGWRFLASVSSEFPDVPLLVYSEFDDPFLVGSLVQRGVSGVVSKRDEMHEVLAAVRALADGERYLSMIARASLQEFSALPAYRRFTSLTRRQMEVTGLMLCGLSVCETARLLHRRQYHQRAAHRSVQASRVLRGIGDVPVCGRARALAGPVGFGKRTAVGLILRFSAARAAAVFNAAA